MEQTRQRDRYEEARANQERTELSLQLQERTPELCSSCSDCTMYRMRLATRSALRGEMTSAEAIEKFDDFVANCPGTSDYTVCSAKGLQT